MFPEIGNKNLFEKYVSKHAQCRFELKGEKYKKINGGEN
jgi:hypothetical protein